MSVLYAGDTIAAVHIGMRSRSVLHYWFPTYNPDLQKYSPGSIILLRMAEAAATGGITRLDLGHGDERYKLRFQSGEISLASGAVDRTLFRRVVTSLWYTSREWSRNSPLRRVIRTARQAIR